MHLLTGISKDLNLRLVSIVSSLTLLEATGVFIWTHHKTAHGLWCHPELLHFPHLNQVTTTFCRMNILNIHFSAGNLPQERLWNRKGNHFDLSSTSGLKAGSPGLVLRTRGRTGPHPPQLSFQCPFQWLRLTSLQQVHGLEIVSFSVGMILANLLKF